MVIENPTFMFRSDKTGNKYATDDKAFTSIVEGASAPEPISGKEFVTAVYREAEYCDAKLRILFEYIAQRVDNTPGMRHAVKACSEEARRLINVAIALAEVVL